MVDQELLLAISNVMGQKLEPVTQEIQWLKSEVQDMKADIQNMKADIQDMKADIQGMKADISALQTKTSVIELILETEIRRNISIVAEGHLDLNRKTDQALQLASEVKATQEIQEIYIRRHESLLKMKGIS